MKIKELIKLHEGLELRPYRCSADKLTIGYGLNLDAGITEEEADYLLANRIRSVIVELQHLDFWMDLSGVRRAVLIDMAYNLGITGFLAFKNMLAAINNKNFSKAAQEMQNSKWFYQVGGRSIRLKKMMESDVWWDAE